MGTSPKNNWNVSYSTISFLETAIKIKGHPRVAGFSRRSDILFEITLTTGICLTALLVDEYTLGMAAVYKARSEFPELDYIVTGGDWNAYTREAKDFGNRNDIGIFTIGEFLGSMYANDPKKFYRKDEKGKAKYAFR